MVQLPKAVRLLVMLAAVVFVANLLAFLGQLAGVSGMRTVDASVMALADGVAAWWRGPEGPAVVYTMAGDRDSERLLRRLQEEDIPFVERNVSYDREAKAQLERLGTDAFLPTLVINEIAVRGDDAVRVEFAIAAYHARHPD